MTLVLKSNQVFLGEPLADINGIVGDVNWLTMLNFADNRFVHNKNNLTFSSAIDYARANSATYIDNNGNEVTVGENVPRLNKDGLLIEAAANNILLNSDNAVSQEVTLDKDVLYSYRVIGSGTINVTHPNSTIATGAVSEGGLGLIQTTVAATKAQVTITGSNTYAQVSRVYAVPSKDSLIHTTTKAEGRNTDVTTIKPSLLTGLTNFTIVMHVSLQEWVRVVGAKYTQPILDIGFSNGSRISLANVIIDRNSPANTPPTQRTRLYFDGAEKYYIESADTSRSLTFAISVTPTGVKVAKNGVLTGEQSFKASSIKDFTLGRAQSWTGTALGLQGSVSHVAIFDKAMSAAELADVSKSWI